ncbi:MAG: putative lipid II flippase FtsW [Candidatus Gastranaerophilales bacterium]
MSYPEMPNRNNRRNSRVSANDFSVNSDTIISSPDRTLMLVVIFLIIIGFLAIFSATAPKCLSDGINPAEYLGKQILSFILGFFAMGFFARISYKKLPKINVIAGIILLILLVLVDYTQLGIVVNGAKRWINIAGFQLQPSELAKPVVVMLLASAFKDNSVFWDKAKFSWPFIPIFIMIFLIFSQPNLSMVILLLGTSVAMYLLAGGSFKWIITMGLAAITPVLLKPDLFIKPYQMQRLEIWKHPELDPLDAGYNIIQSLVAFASGKFSGVGYGASIQKLAYLPECHTDFIFAVIAEEMGFIGCILVIGLFFIFLQRGMIIAGRCEDMYGKLLAMGITISICMQAFLNIAVASSFLPATGIPLPFISYGGSSLIVSMSMVGILLNISKKRIRKIRRRSNV